MAINILPATNKKKKLPLNSNMLIINQMLKKLNKYFVD
jgi:hypothetical protein